MEQRPSVDSCWPRTAGQEVGKGRAEVLSGLLRIPLHHRILRTLRCIRDRFVVVGPTASLHQLDFDTSYHSCRQSCRSPPSQRCM